MRKQISESARKVPGVAYTVEITGLSALDFTNRSNTLTMFLPLKPFDERKGHPEQTMDAILRRCRAAVAGIQDAFVLVVPPPPVQGIGNAGGFKLQLEDRRSAGVQALAQAANELIAAGEKAGGLDGIFHDVPHRRCRRFISTSTATRSRRWTCPSSPCSRRSRPTSAPITSTTSTSWAAPTR